MKHLIFGLVLFVSAVFGTRSYGYDAPQICGGGSCYNLPDGSVWVILGDSITAAHYYSEYLEAYYHLRYPDVKIHFRGEGRGGSTFNEVINQDRYGRRVYSWHPDIVSVMLGHNEGGSAETYDADYRNLITNYIVAKNSATPILFGPHPMYDAIGKRKLGEFADKITTLGTTGHYAFSELWHYLQPIFSANFAKQNPIDLGYVGVDKVHPGASGHLAIVYGLLKQIDADGDVSAITINASDLTHSEVDATITDLSGDTSGVIFDRLDARLPMPWDARAEKGTELIPEIWDMNRYMLTITGLTLSNYDVYIDDVLSASVSSVELAAGWNMAKITKGPIYEQLQEVLGRIRDKEGIDRITLKSAPPWSGVRKYQSNADYAYNTLGLRDNELATHLEGVMGEVEALDLLIYEAATPSHHRFRIVRTQPIRADVNQSGTIDSGDVTLTLRNSLGLSMTGTDWQPSATTGDVNCDDASSSVDAMLIRKQSLGIDLRGTDWCGNEV